MATRALRNYSDQHTTVYSLRARAVDIEKLDRIIADMDYTRAAVLSRLVTFLAEFADHPDVVVYILGLVPKPLRKTTREKLVTLLQQRDEAKAQSE